MESNGARTRRLYLAVSSAGIVLRTALPEGPVTWALFVALVALATWAADAGRRRNRPTYDVPWRLMVVGLAATTLGGTVWYLLEGNGLDTSPSHALYLVAYAAAVASAWRLARHRSPHDDTATLLDTAIVTTGVGILVWVFIAQPTWDTAATGGVPRLLSTLYPMLNLALLAMIARLAFGGGHRGPAYRWIVLGLLGLLGADLSNAYGAVTGQTHALLGETLRLLATTALGAAALHPSMVALTERAEPSRLDLGRWRLAALWTASVVVPLTILVEAGTGEHGNLAVIALGSVILFTLVVARMWGLLGTVASVLRRQHEDRFRGLVEHAEAVIIIVGPGGIVTYTSPSAERVWGRTADEVTARGVTLLAPEDQERMRQAIRDAGQQPSGTVVRFEGRVAHADGAWRYLEATLANHRHDPAIGGTVVTCRDVTTQRELELQLSHQAFHDPLSGLPNRALFADRVEQALSADGRDGDRFAAVLFLDLDDFKTVNDGLGHGHGDELLRIVGERLAHVVRPGDTVARFGGDEFAVLLPRVSSLDVVTALAERLLTALAQPVTLAHRRVEPSASLGIATSHEHPTTEELLRDADAAMYVAKRQGKGGFQVFDPGMHSSAMRRLQLKMDLHAAVERSELTTVYQSIHDVATGEVVGFEALLRWRHPTRGAVPPNEFIPLAEESGSIGAIGEFVLGRACDDIARYRALTGLEVFVTVNVSAAQLVGTGLVAAVAAALDGAGLAPDDLVLELTESVFIADDEAVTETLRALAQLGVRLAIDDFGTGYCSLAYLDRFRFDVVKIDKSFIDVLAAPGGDQRLTAGILELIASLEVPAVAEGIETDGQLEALRGIGCAYGQGYLWSRPVPLHELALPAGAVDVQGSRT